MKPWNLFSCFVVSFLNLLPVIFHILSVIITVIGLIIYRASIFFLRDERLAPYPAPTWKSWVFCQGALPLAEVSRDLKSAGYPPFAVVAQLQCNCITGVMTRTCDSRLGSRAYDTVGISWHLRSTPGGPSVLHQDPLPPFKPKDARRSYL